MAVVAVLLGLVINMRKIVNLILLVALAFAVGGWGMTGGGGGGGGSVNGPVQTATWIATNVGLSVATATTYIWVNGSNNGNEFSTSVPVSLIGTFRNLSCKVNAAVGASNTIVITLRDNSASVGAPASESCTIGGASATTCADNTNTYTSTLASLMALQVAQTISGAAPPSQTLRCTIEYDTSNAAVPSYGVPQTSLLNFGSSGTYTTPAGATWLYVCAYGPGGGGGAATSGGAAALSGGGGGSGSTECGILNGAFGALSAAYTYSISAGGAAGTCSATPTAAANGVGYTVFNTAAPVVNQIVAHNANGGGTASTTVNGTGGAGAAISPITGFNIGALPVNLAGANGANGAGAAQASGGSQGGAPGGLGATVTAGGACNVPATAGGNGFITVTAYFN